MKTNQQISIICMVLFQFCFVIHAQEFVLQVKFKNEEFRQSFQKDALKSFKLTANEQNFEFKPSYPHAKNNELRLYYDVKGFGEKEYFVKELESKNIFQKLNYYDMVFPADDCITTNDSVFADGTDYAVELIRANCAWLIAQGEGVVIGIADSDFDESHEDLSNQFLSVSGPISSGLEHGTLVSGIAGAEPNNGKGIKGIGYHAKIKGYRIIHDSDGRASSVYIKDAIWNAYLDGCDVINVSWTGTGLNLLSAEEITENGTVLVVSAGNKNNEINHSLIADIPGVICVSSVDKDNNYYSGHARNSFVDLCAPGYAMQTTSALLNYRIVWGTSFSSPCVSGTSALLLSANPGLSPNEIENILKITAAPINNASLYPNLLGAGRLDAYAAARLANGYLVNKSVTANKTINCYDAYIKDVIVADNAKLAVNSQGDVIINGNFEVQLGSTLEVN